MFVKVALPIEQEMEGFNRRINICEISRLSKGGSLDYAGYDKYVCIPLLKADRIILFFDIVSHRIPS